MNQPLAYVHPEAKIANNVVIEPFVTISNQCNNRRRDLDWFQCYYNGGCSNR